MRSRFHTGKPQMGLMKGGGTSSEYEQVETAVGKIGKLGKVTFAEFIPHENQSKIQIKLLNSMKEPETITISSINGVDFCRRVAVEALVQTKILTRKKAEEVCGVAEEKESEKNGKSDSNKRSR